MPAMLWILVVSIASSKVSGGSTPASRLASMVLPEPGGPIMSTLWTPAAATSSARFAIVWPRTSPKSGAVGESSVWPFGEGTAGENSSGRSSRATTSDRWRMP
jgi:hypothetical protein